MRLPCGRVFAQVATSSWLCPVAPGKVSGSFSKAGFLRTSTTTGGWVDCRSLLSSVVETDELLIGRRSKQKRAALGQALPRGATVLAPGDQNKGVRAAMSITLTCAGWARNSQRRWRSDFKPLRWLDFLTAVVLPTRKSNPHADTSFSAR